MPNQRLAVLIGFVLAAALFRVLPHPPNFTPIAAIALFSGAYLSSQRLALLVPLLAMLASDLLLGFHGQMLAVYGCFALTVWMGTWLKDRVRAAPVLGAAVGASVLFFAVTNLGVWALDGLYPLTPEGLVACYVAAIPFFQNSLAGDLLYTAVLFGGFALVEQARPSLRASSAH